MKADELKIIAAALLDERAAEREACAALLEAGATQLYGGKSRINQVDGHVASVLRYYAVKIRERAQG